MSPANTSTDGECDRNVRFEIVGIWYKRPRIVVRSMSERSTLLQQISTSVGTSLEGDVARILVKPGYRDLLSYVTFLLDG